MRFLLLTLILVSVILADGIHPPHKVFLGEILPDSTIKVYFSTTQYSISKHDREEYGDILPEMISDFEAQYTRQYHSNRDWELIEDDSQQGIWRLYHRGNLTDQLRIDSQNRWEISPDHYFEAAFPLNEDETRYEVTTIQQFVYDTSLAEYIKPRFFGITSKLNLVNSSDIGRYVVITYIGTFPTDSPLEVPSQIDQELLQIPVIVSEKMDSLYQLLLDDDFGGNPWPGLDSTLTYNVFPILLNHIKLENYKYYLADFRKFWTSKKFVFDEDGKLLDNDVILPSNKSTSRVIGIYYGRSGHFRGHRQVHLLVEDSSYNNGRVYLKTFRIDQGGFIRRLSYVTMFPL